MSLGPGAFLEAVADPLVAQHVSDGVSAFLAS